VCPQSQPERKAIREYPEGPTHAAVRVDTRKNQALTHLPGDRMLKQPRLDLVCTKNGGEVYQSLRYAFALWWLHHVAVRACGVTSAVAWQSAASRRRRIGTTGILQSFRIEPLDASTAGSDPPT
jgi:hypothetical protein